MKGDSLGVSHCISTQELHSTMTVGPEQQQHRCADISTTVFLAAGCGWWQGGETIPP